MKLLFLTEKFPYPLDTGGNVRTYHILRGLATEHQITLLSGTSGEVQPSDVDHMMAYCHNVQLARVGTWSNMDDAGSFVRSLMTGVPFLIRRRYRTELAAAVSGLFAKGEVGFDAVYFNHLDSAVYLPCIPADLIKVLDEHNIVANQVRTVARTETNPLRRWVLRSDQDKVARFEADVANRMNRCLVCSSADAESLRALDVRRDIAVVPNGVDVEFFEAVPPAAGVETLIFFGTLDYDPCEKGVWYFCREILPLIRKEYPSARFLVVGRNPSQRLRDYAAADPQCVLTGRVEDVRPYLWQAHACVVPLLSGSGTRLKILEAMSAGIPVVSTTIGAEGITCENGRHLWLADEPASFADRVVRLLQRREEAQSMRMAARALVEENYSWRSVHERLLDEFRSLAPA